MRRDRHIERRLLIDILLILLLLLGFDRIPDILESAILILESLTNVLECRLLGRILVIELHLLLFLTFLLTSLLLKHEWMIKEGNILYRHRA